MYYSNKNNTIVYSDSFINDLFYYFKYMDIFPSTRMSEDKEHVVLAKATKWYQIL